MSRPTPRSSARTLSHPALSPSLIAHFRGSGRQRVGRNEPASCLAGCQPRPAPPSAACASPGHDHELDLDAGVTPGVHRACQAVRLRGLAGKILPCQANENAELRGYRRTPRTHRLSGKLHLGPPLPPG